MGAPKSRGKPFKRFKEKTPPAPPPKEPCMIHVSYTRDNSEPFVVTFSATRTAHGRVRAARLAVTTLAVLRKTVLETQRTKWRSNSLWVNPQWSPRPADRDVQLGGYEARGRGDYIKDLISSFNQNCAALNIADRMIPRAEAFAEEATDEATTAEPEASAE